MATTALDRRFSVDPSSVAQRLLRNAAAALGKVSTGEVRLRSAEPPVSNPSVGRARTQEAGLGAANLRACNKEVEAKSRLSKLRLNKEWLRFV